jgi:hypothetical protein
MPRFLHLPSPDEVPEEDPLAGIANLFDVSVVFIVGLMITLFSVYRMGDLVDTCFCHGMCAGSDVRTASSGHN